MGTLGSRLREYRKTVLKIGQEDFAQKIGVLQGHISNWETDKVKPDAESLTKILMACPTLNPAWLVFDIGGMEKPEGNANPDFTKRENELLRKVERLREKIESLNEDQHKNTK